MFKNKIGLYFSLIFFILAIPIFSSAEHVKALPKKEHKKISKIDDHTRPLNTFELGKYQYCGADKDCVVANNGCCDCANGGIDVAVNKVRLTDFETRFKCENVACGFETSKTNCGTGVVSCVEHVCHYF